MKYSETHEWVLADAQGIATVGISKEALKELGEVVYVELPKVGIKLKKGDEACVIESTKAAADIYAPVSGKVVAVNRLDEERLDLLNTSPEEGGWLYKLRLEDPKELDALLTPATYHAEVSKG